MVFVLELDDTDDSSLSHRHLHDAIIASSPADTCHTNPSADKSSDEEDRPNPNLNGFSAALGCYP
jgi:hypothetical protein